MSAATRGEFLSGLGAAGLLAAIGTGASLLGRRAASARRSLNGFRVPSMKEVRVFVAGERAAAQAAALRLGTFPGVTVVGEKTDCDVVYNLTAGKERTRVIAAALGRGRHVVSPDGIGAYPTECLNQILLAEEKRLHLTALPTTLFDGSVAFFRDAERQADEIDAVELRKTFVTDASRFPGEELAPVFRLLGAGSRDGLKEVFAVADKGGGCETVISLASGIRVAARCVRGDRPGCEVVLHGTFGRRTFAWDPADVDGVVRDRAWISALQEGRPMPVSAYEAARIAVVADQADWSANNDSVRLAFPRFERYDDEGLLR